MQIALNSVFNLIKSAIALLLSVIMLIPSVFNQSKLQAQTDEINQLERVAALEQSYKNGEIKPLTRVALSWAIGERLSTVILSLMSLNL